MVLLLLLLFAAILTPSVVVANVIEVFISHENHHDSHRHGHHSVILFPNVSLGLQHVREDHQCLNGKKRTSHPSVIQNAMGYTPNRRLQKESLPYAVEENVRLGFVLALGAHSNQYYDYGPGGSVNGLMTVWDSWTDFFLPRVSNSTSLIMLLDERDFRRQNNTRSVGRYIDSILVDNMGARPVDCVSIRKSTGAGAGAGHGHGHGLGPGHQRIRRKFPLGCVSNDLDMDQGYKVYYFDVYNASNPETFSQSPFIIFASVYKFPAPEWAKDQDEETLFIHWRPWRMGRFKTNYGYVKMTNWYAYHQLNLNIIDYFDYAGKLDNDVSFVAPFPEPNLPLRLARKEAKMLVSANGWYFDEPRVAQGIRQCLNTYISEEQKLCNGVQLMAGGQNATIFWESNLNATFRAHFLVYWLGIYAAPETKHLARYWNDWHPRGMWDYRWGDQQWWPRPLSMFGSGNVDEEVDHFNEINTDNQNFVVHKLWSRQATVGIANYFNYSGSTRQIRDEKFAVAVKPFL